MQVEKNTLDISGVTDLMIACYNLDSETCALAIELGDNVEAEDAEGNTARTYLFAGYNQRMDKFRRKYYKREYIDQHMMSSKDRDEYTSLNENLILTLKVIGLCCEQLA